MPSERIENMANAKETPQNTPSTAQADALAAYKAAHGGKAPPSTKGEKLFNALDYWGLGWVANAVISIYWADAAEHTYAQPMQNRLTNYFASLWPFKKAEGHLSGNLLEQSERLYQALKDRPEYVSFHQEVKAAGKGIDTFFEKIGTPSEAILSELHKTGKLGGEHTSLLENFEHLKAARLSKYGASKVVGFAMLNIGGWLLLAPMKLLEDRKEKIVPTLDKWLGSEQAKGDAKEALQARHEELKHEPKQTWTSELLARTISTPLIVGLYYNTRAPKNMLSKAGVPFEGADLYADKFATKAIASLRRHPEEELAIERKLGQGTAKIAAKMRAKGQENLFNEASGQKRLHNIFKLGFLEVIYSAVMATLVFSWSRVTGIFLGEKKQEDVPSPAPTPQNAAPVQPALEQIVVNGMAIDTPSTKVAEARLEKEPAQEKSTTRPELAAMASHAERAAQRADGLDTQRV